jgi:hypothetical protein
MAAPPAAALEQPLARPRYALHADVDMKLLTFNGGAKIDVPVAGGDAMKDAVFFIFANAGGVGGDDERVRNIDVSSVKLRGAAVPFKLDGAVLRVSLPAVERSAFSLDIAFHGVVPRAPKGAGGVMEMMGGMDLGSLFGGGTGAPKEKPKNVDYGLYSYGDGVLSLGSFWYPTLAVRKGREWVDEAPEGLGDVAYAELSDYSVSLTAPANVSIAATGQSLDAAVAATAAPAANGAGTSHYVANGVRDFSVVMSEDFVTKSKIFDVAGKPVSVSAFTTREHAAKADEAIDIAGHALQIYAKRFGPYRYSIFKVVEGPIRGGAGGMEYSGTTTIATMLYGDLVKELGGLADSLGAPGLDAKALENIIGDDDAGVLVDADAKTKPASGKPAGKAAGKTAAKPTAGGAGAEDKEANPAADLLGGLLGGQKDALSSVFEMTIAHEVAHQWWAIGVGSDSQREPWMDESLTNYSAIVYFEDRYGAARAQKMLDTHLKSAYSMARMLGQKDAPVDLRTSAYDGNVQYGAVVYGKGALFYDTLRGQIGDAAFFGALRDYFAAENGRLAEPSDLMGAFEARAPGKKAAIAALWKRWIEETHGDDDITGGPPTSLADMLGGLMGGGQEQ